MPRGPARSHSQLDDCSALDIPHHDCLPWPVSRCRRLTLARPLPGVPRQPVRRARPVADPERRCRRLRRVRRRGGPAADSRRAPGGRGCPCSRAPAHPVLAPRAARCRERAPRRRLGRERGRAVVRAAGTGADPDVDRDLDDPHRRDLGHGRVDRARATHAGRRARLRWAADRVDRRHADHRRGRGGRTGGSRSSRSHCRQRCSPGSPFSGGRTTLLSPGQSPRSGASSAAQTVDAGR